jgi:hypothetical protein
MGQLMTGCFIWHVARILKVFGAAIDSLNGPQPITVATIVQRNQQRLMVLSYGWFCLMDGSVLSAGFALFQC